MKKENIDEMSIWKKVFSLAQKGRGHVFPNPEVGCVIIKNGEIIGEGYHETFGASHAEVNAIAHAEEQSHSIENADIYVSLEPCCHTNKKTPPCAQLLIEKKAARVFICQRDPNPEVSGKGVQMLRENRVEVLFASQNIQNKYSDFYTIFTKNITKNTPFFTLKIAESNDGYIGKKNQRIPITGNKCREKTLELRDEHQAILVGVQTVITDNPILSGKNTQPKRLVFDASGKLSEYQKYHFFRDSHFYIYTSIVGHEKLKLVFPKENLCILPFLEKSKLFDLDAFQNRAMEQNIGSIFIEGGTTLANTFLCEKVIDQVYLYIAPKNLSIEKNRILGISQNKKLLQNYSKISEKYYGTDRVLLYSKNIV